jgi:hypothetical protein
VVLHRGVIDEFVGLVENDSQQIGRFLFLLGPFQGIERGLDGELAGDFAATVPPTPSAITAAMPTVRTNSGVSGCQKPMESSFFWRTGPVTDTWA